MSLQKRAFAECLGTFWLVFGGCGSAVLAAAFPILGIGFLGVALAFGLSVLTMAYAIGHISGCHLNPAVSIGLAVGRRFPAHDLPAYIGAQVIGGILAAVVLYLVASGQAGLRPGGRLRLQWIRRSLARPVFRRRLRADRGSAHLHVPDDHHGRHRRTRTARLRAHRHRPGSGAANMVGIPVTNVSVNPARSTGPALIVGGWAIEQLWLFWLAPIAGAALAGLAYPALSRSEVATPVQTYQTRCLRAGREAKAIDRERGDTVVPMRLLFAALVVFSTASAQPLRLHPDNPHYFLFAGRPTVLVTSGEHYGAVLNRDFDYARYLDTLRADHLNLTRTFSGSYREVAGNFAIASNTLAPAAGKFLAPWLQRDGKFDLTQWDDAYFARLKDFVAYAGRSGVIVEFVLFCPLYEDSMWSVSPMNVRNNVNGIGDVARTDVLALKDARLTEVQDNMVRKIVSELRDFDNLYYEICNEPYFQGVTLAWQEHISKVIAETESGFAEEASDRPELGERIVGRRRAESAGRPVQLPLLPSSGFRGHELEAQSRDRQQRDRVRRSGGCDIPHSRLGFSDGRRSALQQPGLLVHRGTRRRHLHAARCDSGRRKPGATAAARLPSRSVRRDPVLANAARRGGDRARTRRSHGARAGGAGQTLRRLYPSRDAW